MISVKPSWLKIRPPTEKYEELKVVLRSHKINTVCEESHCPNMSECWSGGTATFILMGNICTRGCRFCQIKTGKPLVLDENEPVNVASSAEEMNLSYVVLTTVDRDDLEDQGADHLSKCVVALKNRNITTEILGPDFRGDKKLLRKLLDSRPDVFAHNIETVRRLTPYVRDIRASYDQTLKVLKNSKLINSKIYTKSSIMVGLGETEEELFQTLKDLKEVGVDIVTIGQYLQPSEKHLKVESYISPEQFKKYEEYAKKLGFLFVVTGPFVRSSYKAGEHFAENIKSVTNSTKLRGESK